MVKKKKKTATMKRRALKGKVGKGKPKGQPPKALQRNRNESRGQNQPAKVAARAINRAVRRKGPKRPRAVAPPPREVGLLDAIGEAMAVCEELAQEMHDWSDNMPEGKQGSVKQGEVDSAAETLDEAVGDDPCDGEKGQAFLNEIKITIQDPTPKRQARSRSTRLGDAMSIINDVMEKIKETDDDATWDEGQSSTATEVHDALEGIESNLQGVEFPGMFG